MVVRAHRRDDILAALHLAEEFGFNLILAGGADAPLAAAQLAARDIPVLVQPDLQPQHDGNGWRALRQRRPPFTAPASESRSSRMRLRFRASWSPTSAWRWGTAFPTKRR